MMTPDKALKTLDDLAAFFAVIGHHHLVPGIQNLKTFIADQQEQYQNLRDGAGRLFADLAQNIGEVNK